MKKIILVIDDELDRTSVLGLELRRLLEPKGFMVEFCQNGKDGIKRIKTDNKKQIKVVLLDIIFKNQEPQGVDIFKAIKDIRLSLPTVILTIQPVRGEEFKIFSALGADLYMEKRYLKKRGLEQANFIEQLARGEKMAEEYTLVYKLGLDAEQNEFVDINIVDKNGNSILKKAKRVKNLSSYLELCINKIGKYVSKDKDSVLKDWDIVEFYKEVYKLNEAIKKSSGGRVPRLLIRENDAEPRSCKLAIKKVKERK